MEIYLKRLQGYQWPGNIRELISVCERLALLCASPPDADLERQLKASLTGGGSYPGEQVILRLGAELSLKAALDEAERQYITAILERNENNQSATAQQLGIGRTTLWRRLNTPQDEQA